MACETLKSAEMIVGSIENAYALTMEANDGMLGTSTKLNELIKKIPPKFKHIIVIADLLGGTPCNVAIEKLISREDVTLLSGLNLAMVIEFAMSQYDDYEKLKEHLIEVGRNGIKDMLADIKNNLDE
jgi:PTS system mannose-specific IIA component